MQGMLMWGLLSVARADNPFRIEVTGVNIEANQTGNIKVLFVVPEGFHLYQDMMTVTPSPMTELQFSEPQFPIGHLTKDPANPEQMRMVFDSTIEVMVPVSTSVNGQYEPHFEIRYQGCKDTLCYMPATENISTWVHVGPKEAESSKKEDSCWFCFWNW